MSSAPVKQEHSEKQWASWLIIIVALLAVIGAGGVQLGHGQARPSYGGIRRRRDC